MGDDSETGDGMKVPPRFDRTLVAVHALLADAGTPPDSVHALDLHSPQAQAMSEALCVIAHFHAKEGDPIPS